MNRKIKIVLICLVAVVGLSIAGFCALMAAMYLDVTGSWPFKPLDRIKNEIHLSNGGTVLVKAIEQREFRSDGWSVNAQYKPPGNQAVERIGEWEGYNYNPHVYLVDSLVVLPSPDTKTLYVRTKKGKWKFFSMQFPDEHTSLPMSFYTTLTSLTEEEIRSVRKDIDPDERGWSPSIYLKEFYPETREVYVIYRTNLSTTRHIRLKLSEDGSDLTLLDIRKEKTVNTKNVSTDYLRSD